MSSLFEIKCKLYNTLKITTWKITLQNVDDEMLENQNEMKTLEDRRFSTEHT